MLDSIYHIPTKLLFNPDVLCEKNANILPRRRYYATLLRAKFLHSGTKLCLIVFVALRPKSTAMVIHLTTLFPGQA